MEQKISWLFFDNDKLLISRKEQDAFCYPGKYLIYDYKEEYNKIDLINLIYYRKTKEYNMEIDFNNKICKFIFDDKNILKFDLDCLIKINEDKIIIKYKIDDNMKKIIINIE